MSRIRKIMTIAVLAVVVLALVGCSSSIALYLNVEKGDNYKYHVVSGATIDISANGQSLKTNQETTTDYSVKIEDKDSDGNMTFSYKYDALKVKSDNGTTTENYDSSKPDENNPMTAVYKGLIGQGFTAKMNKQGEVKEVKGIDSILNSILKGLGSEDEASKEQLQNTLKQSFGEEAIASMLQQNTNLFPKGDVKVGDSWETSFSSDSFVKIDMKVKLTLDKVKDGIAYISMKADLTTDKTKTIDLMGATANPDLKGTMTGNIQINVNNGFVGSGQITQDMSGNMSIDVAGQKMDIPMKINIKTTYSTVKQ